MKAESLAQTHETARNFIKKLALEPGENGAIVVGLQGDLGSGKTSFVQGAAKELGIESDIQSPTFVIEKIYKTLHPRFKRLIHIDAYRLDSADELSRLGWERIAKDPQNLIMVEWPERVFGLIPGNSKEIRFNFIDENTREITFEND